MTKLDIQVFCDAIYDAVVDDGQWQRVIDLLRHCFPFAQPGIAFIDGVAEPPCEQTFGWIDKASLNAFARELARPPDGNDLDGNVRPDSLDAIDNEPDRHVHGNDWIRLNDGVKRGVGAALFRDGERCALFSVQFDGAAVSHKAQQDLEDFLRELVPHLSRAIELKRALGDATLYSSTLEAALDQHGAGIIVAGPDGDVRYANAIATAYFEDGAHPLKNLAGRLYFDTAQQRDLLDAHLYEVTRGVARQRFARGNAMRVQQGDSDVYVLLIFPLASNQQSDSIFAQIATPDDGQALIFVVDPNSGIDVEAEFLRVAFGVSPAEAELALAIANGETLQDFADRRSISRNTARNQMQSLLEKLGFNRQSQLVALVARTFAQIRSADGAGPTP